MFTKYADELKLFHAIEDFNDCHSLQFNVNLLIYTLPINAKKIFFSLKKSVVQFNYYLQNLTLSRPVLIKDLGVY